VGSRIVHGLTLVDQSPGEVTHLCVELWGHDRAVGNGEGIHHVLDIQLVRLGEERPHKIFILSVVKQQQILSARGYVGRNHQRVELVNYFEKPVGLVKLKQKC